MELQGWVSLSSLIECHNYLPLICKGYTILNFSMSGNEEGEGLVPCRADGQRRQTLHHVHFWHLRSESHWHRTLPGWLPPLRGHDTPGASMHDWAIHMYTNTLHCLNWVGEVTMCTIIICCMVQNHDVIVEFYKAYIMISLLCNNRIQHA